MHSIVPVQLFTAKEAYEAGCSDYDAAAMAAQNRVNAGDITPEQYTEALVDGLVALRAARVLCGRLSPYPGEKIDA